ncbi:hypothetical protein [Cellulomonas phragmiteti]|uniref:Uncharacterized protein n=1 Tax=Cellulomonas phragmiteti TaxID=478780 RepID=A0ABQ4DJV8_9CELL|nr:hypothetical protein [Cellulomonas phragmiteti]GIG39277.1 hypothetical protein Cph01nite_10390 [Cellulomonas phragmiteti]
MTAVRPFTRPAWDPAWSRHVLVDVVYDAMGRYCAACERPLTVGASLYDPGTGAFLGGTAREQPLAVLLPLCDGCAIATGGLPTPADVLHPATDVTFTLTDDSPLRYEPRTVDVDGVPTRVVVAVGATAAGRATVRHYGLNGAADRAGAAPTRPRLLPDDGLLADDPRPDLRTRTWDLAEGFVPLLALEDPVAREAMVGRARTALTHSGFWSVWATVLGAAFPGSDLLPRLLLPPARVAAAGRLAAAARPPGPALVGHAGAFPGTRTDWLPPGWLPALLGAVPR